MRWILSFIFVIGLILACNEGYWFPWLNLIGMGCIAASGILANLKMERDRYKKWH